MKHMMERMMQYEIRDIAVPCVPETISAPSKKPSQNDYSFSRILCPLRMTITRLGSHVSQFPKTGIGRLAASTSRFLPL
jgi:hypothetical protein